MTNLAIDCAPGAGVTTGKPAALGSDPFWSALLTDDWSARPFVVRGAVVPSFATPEAVWTLACAAARAVAASDASEPQAGNGGDRPRIRHWIERHQSFTARPYLPLSTESPAEWAARVSALVGDRDFSLLVHAAQTSDWSFFLAARELLHGFTSRVGISDYVDSTIYLSRARRTVFGIHADAAHNFLFVAHGKKRFRLWPSEVMAAHPRHHEATDWDEIADQATPIELSSGDFLFLPAGYYHAAEAEGDLAIHLSLLVDVNRDMSKRFLLSHVEHALSRRLKDAPSAMFFPASPPSAGDAPLELPEPLGLYTRAFDRKLADEVRRSLTEAWARRRSADGFVDVPPTAPLRAVDDDDVVCVDLRRPILTHVDGQRLLCACNGHVVTVPAHPHLEQLLAEMNRGQPCRVGDLAHRYAGTAAVDDVEYEVDADGIRAFLSTLASMHSFARCGRSNSTNPQEEA